MANQEEIFKSNDPYLKWLRETKGLSKRSIWHYHSYYKHFVKLDPTQENINQFMQKKKNNSVVRGFMKSFLEFLEVENQFKLPAKKTGTKKKKVIRDFSEDQIRRVQKFMYKRSLKDGLIFDIIYYGALRRSEILTIKVKDFSWETWFNNLKDPCELKIFGKGKKERVVLIPPETMLKLIDHYLKIKMITPAMDKNYIVDLLNSKNVLLFNGLYERKIHKDIKKLSERAIGIGIRPHELRHTRATELIRKGLTERDVQQYLGHTNLSTTEIYLHTTQTETIKKIKKIY